MFAYVRMILLGLAASALSPAAWAWGHPGHQLIGSLADELLTGSTASKQVAEILGPTIQNLKTAAPWPDCVRDVVHKTTGEFAYDAHSKYHSPVCTPFEDMEIERPRMEDYAKRNWTNCEQAPAPNAEACHRQYHFADVAVQHDHYDRQYKGTSDHDIVAALQAAIVVLRDGPPAPAPFSIVDKKEALFLIAHLVGDIHQPLHVGAVYIDQNNLPADPDAAPDDRTGNTRGGNYLEAEKSNLHTLWDDIPASLTLKGLATKPGLARRKKLIEAAGNVPDSSGALSEWPAEWASETVLVSHEALAGMSFAKSGAVSAKDWVVTFDDQASYDKNRRTLQQQQITKAAARLAQLLKAIWPDQ